MNILVPESDTLGAIAVIRSLGRAGHTVHAVARTEDALGLLSNFAATKTISPQYTDPNFISWLRAEIASKKIDVIIPSEGFLLAIHEHFEEFKRHIPFSNDKKKLYDGMSKYELFSTTHQEHLPPYVNLDFSTANGFEANLSRLKTLPLPHYIKVDALFSKNKNAGKVYKCETLEETNSKIAELKKDFSKLMVQSHVEGQGVGAFFLVWNQKIIADFMHLRVHEVPYTGGVSSYRKSFFHEAIYADARKRILDLDWKGPAMMEYRYDAKTGEFYLMEMNGRFWGSLHLPVYAGVDFPALLIDCYAGKTPVAAPMHSYKQDVYCRLTYPLEFQHVWSCVKSSDFSATQKLSKIFGFILLGLNPRIYSDLFSFPGDRKLFFISLKRFLLGNMKRMKKLV